MKLYICNETDFKETTIDEIAELTGLKYATVRCKIYDRPSDLFQLKDIVIEVDMEQNKADRIIPKDFDKRWNDIVGAAELIRSGNGKIVNRLVGGRYRKVTVPR